MIRLLVFDAGHTLGTWHGLGTAELAALSPLPKHLVKEEARRFLHTAPAPTREVLEGFCEAVHIELAQLPKDWTSDFRAYPYAAEALDKMIDVTGAPAVVLSNIPCTTGPSRMRALEAQLPAIEHAYTSYGMRMRKPDSRLWRQIAQEWDVVPSQVMHFGDLWINDVRGALRAGCKAVHIWGTRSGNPTPPRDEWPIIDEGRVWAEKTLADAVEAVKEAHAA